MVGGVSTVWLPVEDIERSLSFYKETLGLAVRDHNEEWAEVDADGLTIGLNASDSETPGPDGGAVIAFRPQDGLESAVEGLQDRGVDFAGGISEHPWGRIASFHDPDGNSLQLYEPPTG